MGKPPFFLREASYWVGKMQKERESLEQTRALKLRGMGQPGRVSQDELYDYHDEDQKAKGKWIRYRWNWFRAYGSFRESFL